MRHKLVLFVTCAVAAVAQTAVPQPPVPSTHTQKAAIRNSTPECDACIRRNLTVLAGPSLHGRGSGTEDEHKAAEYIAKKLKQYGLAPAAENGLYIQTATIQSRTVTAPPTLSFDLNEAAKPRGISWEHGKEIVVKRLERAEISAALQKLDLSEEGAEPDLVQDGAVVLLRLKNGASASDARKAIESYGKSQASMIIVSAASDSDEKAGKAPQLPRLPMKLGDEDPPASPAVVIAKPANFDQLWAAGDGVIVKLHADVLPWSTLHTWNVLAQLEGTEDTKHVVMLSAHLDHLGILHGKTYPGADDDGSGTVAVMELARALAKQGKPKRTVVFALWGSEEKGMLGSQYFLKHPTFGLKDLVANLEFEMIGRRDHKVRRNQLWLTGWDLTNLGPALAAHGAKLVADPHPDEHFFERSDNYALAKEGLVAQTVSSFGLHRDYHQPSDTLAKINWTHLYRSIGSMIAPMTWLVDSDFVPQWHDGKRP